MGIPTPFLLSSKIKKSNELKGQDRVIEINKFLGATQYISLIGGVGLYDRKVFEQNDLELKFIRTKKVGYQQYSGKVTENLSIIDVMMFNTPERIRDLLLEFDIF